MTGKLQGVVTGKINMIYSFNIYCLLCTRNGDHREKYNKIHTAGKYRHTKHQSNLTVMKKITGIKRAYENTEKEMC